MRRNVEEGRRKMASKPHDQDVLRAGVGLQNITTLLGDARGAKQTGVLAHVQRVSCK